MLQNSGIGQKNNMKGDNKIMAKEHSYESTVEVLAHQVSYWWKGEKEITPETKEMLEEEAENRATDCIKEGYTSGELNYEDLDVSYRGWWSIKN